MCGSYRTSVTKKCLKQKWGRTLLEQRFWVFGTGSSVTANGGKGRGSTGQGLTTGFRKVTLNYVVCIDSTGLMRNRWECETAEVAARYQIILYNTDMQFISSCEEFFRTKKIYPDI